MDETMEVFSAEIHDEGIPLIDDRTPRQKYVDSLRTFADFLETHPNLELPTTQKLFVFPPKSAMGEYARTMGKCRKSADESYFNLTLDFLPSLQYEPTWYRNQVCERVIVGQKEVTEDIVEVVGKRTVTKDVVEWKCPKVLRPMTLEDSDDKSLPL